MLDYIGWYEVELYSRLKGKVEPDRLSIILDETHSHLREAAAILSQNKGLSEEEAAKSAIKDFGAPDEIADSFLHRSRARTWLPVVVVSAAAVSLCNALLTIWLYAYFDNFGDSSQNRTAGFVAILAVAVLAFACRAYGRSCRLILTGVSVSTAVCLMAVLSFWIIGDNGLGEGISRFNRAADVAGATKALAELKRQMQLQEMLAPIFQKAKSPSELPEPARNFWLAKTAYGLPSLPEVSFSNGRMEDSHFIVPMSPLAMKLGAAYTFGTVSTFQEAKSVWANFASYDRQMSDLVKNMNGMIEEGKHPKLFYWNPQVFGNGVATVVLCWPALLLIDGLIDWSRKRRVRRGPIYI